MNIEKRSQVNETVINITLPIEHKAIASNLVSKYNDYLSEHSIDTLINSCIFSIEKNSKTIETEIIEIQSSLDQIKNQIEQNLRYLKSKFEHNLEKALILEINDPIYMQSEFIVDYTMSEIDASHNAGSKAIIMDINRVDELLEEISDNSYFNANKYLNDIQNDKGKIIYISDEIIGTLDFEDIERKNKALDYKLIKNNNIISEFKIIHQMKNISAVNFDQYDTSIEFANKNIVFITYIFLSILIGGFISLILSIFREKFKFTILLFFFMKKILITGCAGFIGYHLSYKLLLDKKYHIYGIDCLDDYYDIDLKKQT